MNVKELRIGNLVEIGKQPTVIESINNGLLIIGHPTDDDNFEEYYGYWVSTDLCEGEKIEDVKPLPLKEQWLLEHGFIVEQFDYKIPISECGVVWLTLIPQDDMCTAYSVCVSQVDDEEDDSFVFLTDISYVHQIQNFYFLQTNKEL
jgi:hypothetical protein